MHPTADGTALADKVAFLRQPDSYPEAVGEVQAIETHMSWVFLAGEHAYKLKKPFRRERLDYRSAAARRRACHAELRLNRRLAPDVYLGVVALLRTASGGLALHGKGMRIDWLVRMRRLPPEHALEARLDARALEPGGVERIAGWFADFCRRATPAHWTPLAYRRRLLASIDLAARELAHPRFGLEPESVDTVRAALRHFVASRRALLDERVRAHRIVEGHGDLRPEHVYLDGAGQVRIVGCLEFDRDLRLRDPVDELGFLALEAGRAGHAGFEAQLLRAWGECTGDDPPRALVAFYKARNALVRARIAALHMDDPGCGPPEPWRARARDYLQRARACLEVAVSAPGS